MDDNVSPSQVPYSATVVAGGNSYSFRVAAANANGWSPYSDPTPFVQTDNDQPDISSISADSSPVTGTSAKLSAVVSDDGNTGNTDNLTYTWSVTPPSGGDAAFSDDTAASPGVTFTKAGNYAFSLTVEDAYGRTYTRTQSVTVTATLTSLAAGPDTAAGDRGREQPVVHSDVPGSVGASMTTGVTWSLGSGGVGQIDASSGVYTSPVHASDNATFSVIATSTTNGSIAGTATLAVRRGGHQLINFNELPLATWPAERHPVEPAESLCRRGDVRG